MRAPRQLQNANSKRIRRCRLQAQYLRAILVSGLSCSIGCQSTGLPSGELINPASRSSGITSPSAETKQIAARSAKPGSRSPKHTHYSISDGAGSDGAGTVRPVAYQESSGGARERAEDGASSRQNAVELAPQLGLSPSRRIGQVNDPENVPIESLGPQESAADTALPNPSPVAETENQYPIDLGTALQLAGANHLQIALATERIRESYAKVRQADVMWVPSLNAGVGYNRHDGPLQATEGEVIDVGRQSLYFGGGPALGRGAPLSGAAGGPARFFVDLPTSDILFEPLAARQNMQAMQHARRAAENDNILEVALTYQELVRARLQIDVAQEAVTNARQLVEVTESFEAAGEGLAADTQRARAELQKRLQQRARAQQQYAVTSAELARLLRLDSSTQLTPVEPAPVPLEMIDDSTPIEQLIAQGLSRRPELYEHRARVEETLARIEQERWRPWLPHLFAGYSAGGFGGGTNGDMRDFGMRGDFDVLAVWQIQNLGLGNSALRQERRSQQRQASLQFNWIRDQVMAEIAQAYSRSQYSKEQIEYAERQVEAAADALPLNLKGIRDRVIRPIEAQQAIADLAEARNLYLSSVIDYNQAQLELNRALGQPPR